MAWLKWSSASQAKEIIPQSRLYGCWKGSDQFANDFFQAALARRPAASELNDWTARLQNAQGDAQLVVEAQSLGAQVFTSTEYAARNRTDGEYVSDLYWAYLQRAPDAGGLSFWTSEITSCGANQQCRQTKRADVRRAFDQSGEFTEKVWSLCGTSAAAPANGGAGYNFSTARLDPVNRTGGGGVDAYSRNFNFSIPLVSLPGRAGLDLGLTLSYNSLVWTKDATGVTFDADQGFPSPGFRLGFPTVEPKFVNPQLQQAGQPTRYSYLLVTPSGGRVELRQVGTSTVYESADSSYLQLVESGGMPATLLSTDGTQLAFMLLNGSFRCYAVKDRNGNYLSVAYYGDGRIERVTDTLGRAVTFNYDNFQNLVSVTQPWKRETGQNPSGVDETHVWATFGYTNLTLQPAFSDLAVMGEQPGTVIPAVSQVGLSDGSYYKFSYNQWGQVWKATHYAADSVGANGQPNDSHPLSSTRIDLPGSDQRAATPQADCPRFEKQSVWVEYGVMNQSAEVVTAYDTWAPDMASCEVTLPDNTKEVSYYATSADSWKKGLTTSSEVRAGGQVVRTTALTWEHDGAAAAPYPTNPRVTQTTVSDPQGNGRTTRVEYTNPADFQGASGYAGTLNLRLPKKVEVCTAGCSTVLRTTVTDYKIPNLGEYVSRRILGLTRFQYLYEGTESAASLRAQVGFLYDEPNNLQDTFLAALPSQAAQHYGNEYGAGLRWRGNANRVRRYAVDQQTGAVGDYVESRAGFNVTGTAAYSKDALGHKSSVGYADSFFQNVNRTHADPQQRLQTFAYPTTVADPDGFTATSLYNYDMGQVTKSQTPMPNATQNTTSGPVVTRLYDEAGRLLKSSNSVNGAHVETVYDASMKLLQSYATVSDDSLQNPSNRLYSVTALDGLGRARGSAHDFLGDPAASAGDYVAQLTYYDAMGRAVFQSNPTEMSIVGGTWTTAGEDANGGTWKGTSYEYDWKSRIKKVINADGSDRLFDYGGCGCAGGEIVTEQGESVPAPVPSGLGRRTRRVYHDQLGRMWKTESLNWDGSVYAATTTKYDALDQPVRVRQYAGAAPLQEPAAEGSGYQTTTMTYDGHGRLATSHLPEEIDANGQPTASVYEYNPDDTVASVRDARGATTTYSYNNNRHLVTGLTYGVAPGSTQSWDGAQPVTFAYDAAGNRTSMTDGLGSVSYTYDDLSRLTSERRSLTGLPSRPPYELSYEYTPAGALRKLTDPAGDSVTYGYDRAGQLSGVTGSNFANVTTYASGIKYRAWGATKSVSYGASGNAGAATTTYDERMRPYEYALNIPASATSVATSMRERYDYNADGQLRQMTDLDDRSVNFFGEPPADRRFSRRFIYDHVGRVKGANGVNASGQDYYLPFSQSYAYDEFDNQTGRSGQYYYETASSSGGGYVNNRRQGWNYDASGQLTHSVISGSATGARDWTYDAAGRMTKLVATDTANGSTTTKTYLTAYDGDGLSGYEEAQGTSSFVIRSTALKGEVVTRLDASGAKSKTVFEVDGLLRAVQQVPQFAGGQNSVSWLHTDPAGLSEVTNFTADKKAVYDPLGNYVSYQNPPIPPTGFSPFYSSSSESGLGTSFGFNGGSTNVVCLMDNMPASCDKVMHFVSTRVFGVEVPKVITIATYADSPLPQLPGGGGPTMALAAGGRGGGHLSIIIKKAISETVTVYSGYSDLTQYYGILSTTVSTYVQSPNSASNVRVDQVTGPNSNAATNANPPQRPRLRCPPTGEALKRNPAVKRAMEAAVRRSNFGHPDPAMRREAGAWIYYNPVTGRVITRDIPTRQTSFEMTNFNNAPVIPNYVLAGDMHVHPTLMSQGGRPGVSHEIDIQFRKGVPGIAVTELGPTAYGPNRLGSNPDRAEDTLNGYPGPITDTREQCPDNR